MRWRLHTLNATDILSGISRWADPAAGVFCLLHAPLRPLLGLHSIEGASSVVQELQRGVAQ